ncbi:hypothetical protein GCM10010275_69090 [Streptomyces litmocidini]|uniref:hypothetical protein n=1 Tax=Streptomyces litmocidini TaxID=67318 RepID=UPI00167EF261|nr:hypothetical protein [Streptomyces litmocidini]GGV17708.1 hypothetical protein GCM10010275_69090 [Streptomyces litmocidini]
MTADWYVLIEEDTRTTERADGTDLKLHRWMLTGTHRIGPDRADAAAAAEDAALHHIPGILARHARPGDEPARHALLTQDGAWIVIVKQRHRECHIRVTTAQLVHEREEKEGPSKSLKEKLRSAMEGPAPAPKPWSWTPGKADRA